MSGHLIDGPGQLQDLQGQSYLYAILTDPRVLADEPRGASSRPDGSSESSDAATDGGPPYAALARSAAIAVPRRPAPAGSREPDRGACGQHAGGVSEPRRALLIIPCSAAKVRGGQPPLSAPREEWPEALRRARAQSSLMRIWIRAGIFPPGAGTTAGSTGPPRPALTAAAAAGSVVIMSGGYGVVRAQELIGWYDKVLRLADWPPSLLESALIEQARRAGWTRWSRSWQRLPLRPAAPPHSLAGR